jgi:hypothetical protein
MKVPPQAAPATQETFIVSSANANGRTQPSRIRTICWFANARARIRWNQLVAASGILSKVNTRDKHLGINPRLWYDAAEQVKLGVGRPMKAFEKVAFSLVTLFGLSCFAVVVYGSSPDTRDAVHEVMRVSSTLPASTCSMSPADPCTMYWLN